MWHFCAALHTFADYLGWIIARDFHKATRNGDLSRDCLLCPASIFSLSYSAECVLLWTTISNRLFSSALLCQLTLSAFSGSFLPASTQALCVGFVQKQTRRFLWVAQTQTETKCYSWCHTPFPGLLHFTLDTYLILLSVNQEGIKYHF